MTLPVCSADGIVGVTTLAAVLVPLCCDTSPLAGVMLGVKLTLLSGEVS